MVELNLKDIVSFFIRDYGDVHVTPKGEEIPTILINNYDDAFLKLIGLFDKQGKSREQIESRFVVGELIKQIVPKNHPSNKKKGWIIKIERQWLKNVDNYFYDKIKSSGEEIKLTEEISVEKIEIENDETVFEEEVKRKSPRASSEREIIDRLLSKPLDRSLFRSAESVQVDVDEDFCKELGINPEDLG